MDKNSEKDIIHVIKSNIAKMALRKYGRADLRTLTIFHKNGIFLDIAPDDEDDLLEVLNSPGHPDRISSSPGPLFFRCVNKKPPHIDAINVSTILLDPKIEYRRVAYAYLYQLKDQQPPYLLKRTIALFDSLKDQILSEDDHWRDASIKLYDAVNDDWWCNCAAFVQSLEKKSTRGINDYLTRIVRPSISSIDSIDSSIISASQQMDQVQSIFIDIVKNESNLNTALDKYMYYFGHLPLSMPYSMSSYIDEWQAKYNTIEDAWNTLWNWANMSSWPLRRYHICTYFLYHPEHVPDDELKNLWNEVFEIVFIPKDKEEDTHWTPYWRFFADLASHYCCYLESRLPYKDGEQIASQALWLAHQVCSFFVPDEQQVKNLAEETFLPDFVNSASVWQLASPPISPSFLRHVVMNCETMFSISLLPALEANLSSLNPHILSKDVFDKLTNRIIGILLSIIPHKNIASESQVYTFQKSCIGLSKKWLNFINDEDEKKEMLSVLFSAVEKIMNTEKLSELLNKIPDSNQADQILITTYFRNLVFVEDPSLDEIWDLMNQTEWRKMVLQDSHPSVLNVLSVTLNEIESRYQFMQDRWTYNLPHYYAMACEDVEEEKRKEYLFSCVIRSSICGNTTSGIERLLKGENRFQYESYINSWNKHLKDALEWSPGWVKARIRPILAVLDSL